MQKNHKNRIALLFVLLLAWSSSVMAQDKLSFNQALELMLENNYNIRQAKISFEKTQNSSAKSNNGYLPVLSGNAAYNWTYYQGSNELITRTVDYNANNSFNYNAALNLSYTLYDGQGRKYNYLQSVENMNLSSLQIQQLTENSIVQLTQVFHEVARLEENVALLQESITISKKRLKRSEYLYEFGQGTQLEILNAQVDKNNDSIALIQGIQELANMKRDLNYLMGVDVEKQFTVLPNVAIRRDLKREEVLAALQNSNLQIQNVEHLLKLSEYATESNKSAWMPRLNANLAYQYRGSDDPNGAFVIGSSNFGPNGGLSLSWNVFDATTKVRVQNAKLDMENRTIEKEALVENLKAQALKAHGNYLTLLYVLSAQSQNVETAARNFDRSTEALRLGQITSIEFRQAQLNLLNAKQALSSARFNAKNAEVQLLALMGQLVKN